VTGSCCFIIQVDSSAETDAEYNFTTSFDCSFIDGHHNLGDIASKPVLGMFCMCHIVQQNKLLQKCMTLRLQSDRAQNI